MNPIDQPEVEDFVNQISLVAMAPNMFNLPTELNNTWGNARWKFVNELEFYAPLDLSQASHYGSQIGSSIRAEARKYHNTLAIMETAHKFIGALGTFQEQAAAERVSAMEKKEDMTQEAKTAERSKLIMRGKMMDEVCWHICAYLFADMKAAREAGLVQPYATGNAEHSTPNVTLPTPLSTSPESESELLTLSPFLLEEPEQDDQDIEESEDETAGSPMMQTRATLLWMKEHEVWSITGHEHALSELLQTPVFGSRSKDDEGYSKLRRRVRNRVRGLRDKLLKEEAAVRGEKVNDGGSRKESKLVFADWTDAWLEDNWDGTLMKPAGLLGTG